ncbi:hypothetical protein LDENG_00078980, partial [Lucifuga dentata]
MVDRQFGLRVGLQVVQTEMCSQWSQPSRQGLFQDGDVVIGGLFGLGQQSSSFTPDFTSLPHYNFCTGINHLRLKYTYALAFAVEKINHDTTLLPGVRLGYRILDSCGQHGGMRGVLSLVGGKSVHCSLSDLASDSDVYGEGGQSLPLIIGADSSVAAEMFSIFLEPMSVPVISYVAGCPCLSDRQRFPNFFRTVPSDIYQTRTMAQLAMHFHWTWIGAVIANNDFGHIAIQTFKEEVQGKGVCLAFVETLSRDNLRRDIRQAALTIEASSARVILIISWYTTVRPLFLELAQRNVTDRQYLATTPWSTRHDAFQNPALTKMVSGILGVAPRSSAIPGFEKYLRSLHPSQHPADVFLREFWEKEFGCSLGVTQSHQSSDLPPCSGTESLEDVQDVFTDTLLLRWTYNVYLAVYAAAHALHSLLSCPDRDSPPTNNSSTCLSPKHIRPEEVLQHLNKVNFTAPHGGMFYFQGADITARYDLVNWQNTPEGSLKSVLIGHVDGSDLHLNESAIQWSTKSNQVPVSVCSESCSPGTRKATRKGKPVCCFDCIQCAEGEFSNKTDSSQCLRCPSEFWSNPERTACIPRELDFLSFNETLGITLTTVAVSGVMVTVAVFVVFLCFHQTPVVRANNSELSFLLLVSLKLCFLCSLVFIGRPTVWACRFQQAAFGISFVLCVSCLQVKTIVVLAAFRSARPGAGDLIRWFGPNQQRGSVCFFTCIQ